MLKRLSRADRIHDLLRSRTLVIPDVAKSVTIFHGTESKLIVGK